MNSSARKHIIRNTFLALMTIGTIMCCWFGYQSYQRQQSIAFVESYSDAQVRYDQKPFPLLPGRFHYYSKDVRHLSLHTWGEEQGSLHLLGNLETLDTLCLLSPENVSTTNLKLLGEIEALQSLTLTGDDSFIKCLSKFPGSHVQSVSLRDHELTMEEAEQLTQIPKLHKLILTNVSMQPAVIQHLKEADITRLSYSLMPGQDSEEESQVNEVMQFLQNYGPVDQIHWNNNGRPDFNTVSEMPTSKKELAFVFDQTSLLATNAHQAWDAIDTSKLTDLSLNPHHYTPVVFCLNGSIAPPDADLSKWPNDKFPKVQSLKININNQPFDLKETHRFPNLETLNLIATISPAFHNLESLSELIDFKHLTISGTLQNYPLKDYLLHFEQLEQINCLEGEITISLLDQLMQQPTLKIIECVPVTDDKLATDEQIMVELERLGTQHRWKARKTGPQCFTLERITSQPTH